MSVAPLSHNIYPLPAATLRKNMKEPYVWGNGKRKGENGKVKALSNNSSTCLLVYLSTCQLFNQLVNLSTNCFYCFFL